MLNKSHSILAILLIAILLFVLPLMVHAQDIEVTEEAPTTITDSDVVIVESPATEESLPPWAMISIPPILLGLMALNNRATEWLKLILSIKAIDAKLPKEIKSQIVLVFSALFGIGSAYFTPNAFDWLGPEFAPYPFMASLITGVAVSTGAATIQMLLYLLDSFRKISANGASRNG